MAALTAQEQLVDQRDAPEDASTTATPRTTDATILREYGVIHLRGALSEREQARLFAQIASEIKSRPPSNPIPANFHLSSGDVGSAQRRQPLHDLGELLYARFAREVGARLTADEVKREPSLRRIARARSGEQPVRVDQVTGVGYLAHSVLENHQDGPMPLYTLSLALGDACDFVVGEKPRRAFPNVRAGAPTTLRMESGDAVFFDGGSVPHAVARIHRGTAPPFWQQAKARPGARVSVLFREADGWDPKYLGD